jgi:hypothetical protein
MWIAARFVFLLSIVTFCQVSMADCDEINDFSGKNGVYIPGDNSGRQAVGKGRLQFYSAPDERCRKDGVFILPAEKVNAYYEYEGYTSVTYFNLKTGASASGWVKSNRLKSTGLGIAPHQQ